MQMSSEVICVSLLGGCHLWKAWHTVTSSCWHLLAVLIEGENELMVANIILALYSENINGVYYWHHYQNRMIPLSYYRFLCFTRLTGLSWKQQSVFGAVGLLHAVAHVQWSQGQSSSLGSVLPPICGNPDVILCLLIRSNLSLCSVWLGSNLSLLTSDSAGYVIFILNAGFHILF